VLVDGENVRRSIWPNVSREDLAERVAVWGQSHGYAVSVVWEGATSADDVIAERVRDIDGAVWVVTSDRELRERVAPYTERLLGGGSFVRELDQYRGR
jgi:hypothetical protein